MQYRETDPNQRVEDIKNALLETRQGFGISVMKLACMREFPVFRHSDPRQVLGMIACAFDLSVRDSVLELDGDWSMPAIENALGLYDSPRYHTKHRRRQLLEEVNYTISLPTLLRLEVRGATRVAHNYDAVVEAANQAPDELAAVLTPLTHTTPAKSIQQRLYCQEFLDELLAQ